ncbi:MAG: hypothetical protein Q9218_003190 [Villophora microphyllina]
MISNTPGSQLKAHIFQQPTRPVARQSSASGTPKAPSRSEAEPALKRQRLDHRYGSRGPLSTHGVLQDVLSGQDAQIQRPSSSSEPLSSNPGGSPITHPSPLSIAPLLFPVRSAFNPSQVYKRYLGAPSQRDKRRVGVAQTKPFSPNMPPRAPRYPPHAPRSNVKDEKVLQPGLSANLESAADFLPWRGNHAEDVLSESSTKQGFYDKIQVSQTESSTGRPHIWSSLRHKSGLQVLSSLFVAVLDHRQTHGTITAGCTFKPPPRVTLTDSKREAWLRDLANPNIPLRRLSRTIPHGIRGRTLLDHCLAKGIPTARALWLAKCVGANEIRAFKRKGTGGAFAAGGEIKWIRDWTVNVEQFLDANVQLCGSPKWSEELSYGLQLAGHLLAENLLDKGHYLDWLLNAVRQSDPDKLSVYLLLTRSHLEDICRSRLFGQRLVDSLLSQLYMIRCETSPDLHGGMIDEIEDLLRNLLSSSPASFLLPESWQKYEPLLRAMTESSDPVLYAQLEHISMRNMRMRTSSMSCGESDAIIDQEVISILDTMSSNSDLARFAMDLWATARDPDSLIRICLQWSSSVFRSGQRRIYIAASLLRKWHGMGIDVESCILNFLSAESNTCGLERTSLYRVIAELARTKHFSLSNYLQWAIATGVLSRYDRSQKFQNLFSILEDTQDFVAMAETLECFSKSQDPQLLTAVTNIVSHYSDIFIAIGAADPVFMRIYRQYENSDGKTSLATLLEALNDLARILPNRFAEAQALRTSLQKSEQKLGLVACSPISEHMAEAIQADSPGSSPANTDEIEQLLASGTSMDKRLLANVFELIWKRFEVSWTGSIQISSVSAALITRLRSFDVTAVNELMDDRIKQILNSGQRPKLLRLWVPLVCAQTTSLQWLFDCVLATLPEINDLNLRDVLVIEAIEVLSADRPKADSSIDYLYHRFLAQQQRMVSNPSHEVVLALKKLLERARATQDEASAAVSELRRDDRLQSMLRPFLDSSPQGWNRYREVLRCNTIREAEQILDRIVFSGAPGKFIGHFDEAALLTHSQVLALQYREAIRNAAQTKFFAMLNGPPNSTENDLLKRLECLLSCIDHGGHHVHSTASATRILVQIYDRIIQLLDVQGSERDSLEISAIPCIIFPQGTLEHIK